MACEKHRQSLNDASLGELDPQREIELLAHAAECDACRESYNHARELRGGIDQAVAALVSGELSPYFASRLRARIATEDASTRSPWRSWAPVAIAALALAALSVTLLVRSSHHASRETTPTASTVQPMGPPAANSAAATPSAPSASSAVRNISVRAAGKQAHRDVREVLTPRGQVAAAFAVMEAVANSPIEGRPFVASSSTLDEPIELKELEIAPLEKPAPIIDSEDSGKF